MENKKLVFLKNRNGLDFYEYRARLFNYFPPPRMAPYEKLFTRCIRETLDYIRGKYHVIYCAVGDNLVGHATIVRGGGIRYGFCTKNDAVLVNLWIQENERGKGYASSLVGFVIEYAKTLEYENTYAFVRHDNQASKKSMINNGMELVYSACVKGCLHRFTISEDGEHGIYKKDNSISVSK